MHPSAEFLTLKQAAQQVKKSEQTIRRLVKQHVQTSHVIVEQTPKGSAYLISQAFLAQHYPTSQPQLPGLREPDPTPALAQLQQQLAERDQTIQHLQHRLLEQNDVLNALTSQVNSQRIGYIEELLLRQNEQLGEMQKRLPEPEPSAVQLSPVSTELPRKSLWQRVFSK